MNIFSAKYKAHRLVNYIFYIIVFFFGFLVGVGVKKINIKTLMPQILMIDSANAFELQNDYGKTLDEEFIFNLLTDNISNFDYNTTPLIYVNTEGSTLFIWSFTDTSVMTKGTCETYSGNYPGTRCRYQVSNGYQLISYNMSNSTIISINNCLTCNSTSNFYSMPSSGWKRSSWRGASNFDFPGVDSSYNSTINKYDFSDYLSTIYMSISYLDNSYNVISSTDCTDNTMDYCSLSINSNAGSYIKITYFLDNLINRRLDFLPNSTYRLKTTLIGSNLDTRVSYINPWFYFNDSTQNVDSDLLPAFNKSISYFNDSYSYSSDFTIDDDYNSYSVYEISVFYNTNSSYYSTISIPYEFSLNDVTSGDTPIVEPTTPDDNINKDDIIIDQNSQLINNQNITNQNLTNINNSINNDNINGASSQASSFFSDFNTDTHGLTGIITAPLNLISSITSTTCSSLVLPVPFVNVNLTLPCLSSIYSQFFGSFLTIYQSITFGIVAYWVCVRIFNLVKDFKNPDHDEIEVLDL